MTMPKTTYSFGCFCYDQVIILHPADPPFTDIFPTMCLLSIASKSIYFIDLNEPHNAHSNQ